MTGDKDDGRVHSRLDQFSLKLKAANPREPDVENEATGAIMARALQKSLGCGKRLRSQSHAFQQAVYRGAHARIIVDDKDQRLCRAHVPYAAWFGRVK